MKPGVGPRQCASVSPLPARLDSSAPRTDNDSHVSLRGPPPYRRPRPSSSWSRALVHGRTTRVARRPRRERPLLRMAWEGPFCFRPFAMHAGERSQRVRAARGVPLTLSAYCHMYSFTPHSQPARHTASTASHNSFARPIVPPNRHTGSRTSPRNGGSAPAIEPQQPVNEGGCPQADGEP